MLIQTLLNDCHKFSGFKYGKITFNKNQIVIELFPDKRYKAKCSKCNEPGSTYDHLRIRKFLFIPIWGYKVEFKYKPRRVLCKKHGVVVEFMPWANGKSPVCKAFSIFLAHWAKKMSWKEVANSFHISWDSVFTSIKYVVDYGLKHRELSNIKAIGVDEVKFKKGYKFATLVYEITSGSKRLLWIGEDRTSKTLLRFFHLLGKKYSENIKVASSDMWKPYLKVIKKKIPQAKQILDRFHIMKKFNEAIEDVRRKEVKSFQEKEEPNILHNCRWSLLKNKENLTINQALKLKELVAYNLKSFKARLLRESFQKFWTYKSKTWAKKFLQQWCFRAMRSKIEPIKKVAKMLRRHENNILNWFDVHPRVSNGIVEGFNNKVKLIMRRSYGFKTFSAFEIALYHSLGKLPEPELAHQFC